MNRQEEYEALRHELSAPALAAEHTFARARIRNKRRMRVVRPLVGLASAIGCFVLLVNISTPVAAACARVPYLRELADAVSFSHSLADAVRHSYAQPVNLEQTDGDITVKVEYLIVDQKQVNVFFRVESKRYEALSVSTEFCSAGDTQLKGYISMVNDHDVPNGKLQSATIDFIDGDVPDKLLLRLKLRSNDAPYREEPVQTDGYEKDDHLLGNGSEERPDHIAKFDFILVFDPNDTARGRRTEIGKSFELDGQTFTLTDIEVYPTHIRVNVEGDPDNTAWLKRLDFHLVVNGWREFKTVKNGVSATGMPDSPMMKTYRADSIYFYDAKSIDIVITGAEMLEREMERVRVDLITGTAERMPQGAELWSVQPRSGSYFITVRAAERKKDCYHQIFMNDYYDAAGTEYMFNNWSVGPSTGDERPAPGYFYTAFTLVDYPYTEVWLTPSYSSEWVAPTPITVNIK